MYVCVPCARAVPTEAREGHQLPWNWRSGWSRATLWVLGIDLVSLETSESGQVLTCIIVVLRDLPLPQPHPSSRLCRSLAVTEMLRRYAA